MPGRTGARRAPRTGSARWRPFRASVRGFVCASALLAACHGGGSRAPRRKAAENDVPVAINSESPFQYPQVLYNQGVEGEVRLRLYVDSTGQVHPESTRVASSSGTPGLDTAAVRGAARLRFAPAHLNGQPVGMAFIQPVIFRRAARPAAAAPE